MLTYRGEKIALLTRHGKEEVLRRVLEPALGCSIEHVTGFDTDLLGTFTRDTNRTGTQLDTARRKARIGMRLSGLPVGLASEGSFAPDPFTGSFTWNTETLVLLDDRLGIEIVGMAQGPARDVQLLTGDWEALASLAIDAGFPAHRLVLRPQGQDDHRIYKDIAGWELLEMSFAICKRLAVNGQVFIESDLRAFANPDRMARIGSAAQDLLRRMQSSCPACAAPGFAVGERQPGLPCSACLAPTPDHLSETWRCVRCSHSRVQRRPDLKAADPRHCARCNP